MPAYPRRFWRVPSVADNPRRAADSHREGPFRHYGPKILAIGFGSFQSLLAGAECKCLQAINNKSSGRPVVGSSVKPIASVSRVPRFPSPARNFVIPYQQRLSAQRVALTMRYTCHPRHCRTPQDASRARWRGAQSASAWRTLSCARSDRSTVLYESAGISAHEYSYPLSFPAILIALLLVRPQTSERLL